MNLQFVKSISSFLIKIIEDSAKEIIKENEMKRTIKLNDGGYSDRIKSIKLYKKEVDNQYAIMGWDEGVIAEVTELVIGIQLIREE